MKTLGIVILYYPDGEVMQNILSYLGGLDKLILWDNTPPSNRREFTFDALSEQRIIRCDVGRNAGIGLPLNRAVRYGLENGFTHLLTMDQDSRFAPGMFEAFLRSVRNRSDAAEVSFSANTHPYVPGQPETEQAEITITSGTIYRLSALQAVGLFREDFFIDAVDTEFCFRARKQNRRMVRINTVYMHHVLGDVTVKPFLWGKLVSPNYSAQRTYYLVRNSLYLRRLYPEYSQAPGTFEALFFWRPLTILLTEPDKYRKFKALLLGIVHAWKGKTGEYALR